MYKAINEADAIVFGSPIYYYQVTGQEKVWPDHTFSILGDMIEDKFVPRHPDKAEKVTFSGLYCSNCRWRSYRALHYRTRHRGILTDEVAFIYKSNLDILW